MPVSYWLLPLVCGVIGVIFALLMARDVLKRPTGTPEMGKVGAMIFEGAKAFLKRQYTTIAWLSIIIAVVIAALVGILNGNKGLEGITQWGIAWRTGLAFIAGAFFSGVSGFIGMYVAVKANVRCAAASKNGLNEAVKVALRGGAVPGFLIVSLSLLGVMLIYFAYGGSSNPADS